MSLTVERTDPGDRATAALLAARQAWLAAMFPPEQDFSLDPASLASPEVALFLARDTAGAHGIGALADRGGYGEVKSMFVLETARGRGVGSALVASIEAEARRRALPCLRLETADNLPAAHRLYARAGFTKRGPFGAYADVPSSVFMEKPLA